jgi:hypothetical protein
MTTSTDGAPNLRVRHCTLTVRRRGGWSWGDPQRYVDLALPALEEALRALVEEAEVSADVDCRVTAPVTLELGRDGRPTPGSSHAVLNAIRAAARSAGPAVTPDPPPPTQPAMRDLRSAPAVSAATEHHETFAAALAAWSRSGRLAAVVRSWSPALLAAWVETIAGLAHDRAPGAPRLSPTAVGDIAAAVLTPAPIGDDRTPDERRWAYLVVLLGAVVAAAGDRLLDSATLDLVLRLTDGAATDIRAIDWAAVPETHSSEVSPAPRDPELATPAVATRMAPQVVPGLPFLVLVQLARLGYLEPALATLVATGVPVPALAAAVASKTLEPPERGWRRSSPARAAVASAAGLDVADIEPVLTRLAAAAEIVEQGWRSALVELYVAGRCRDDELVVTEVGDARLCGEVRGGLPIAWVSAAELAVVLDQLGGPVVRKDPVLAPLMEELAPRRGLPGLDAAALERQLGAAVGSALGSLAVELWGEDADALMALRRLGDLEVLVTPGERLRVAVPRGQRWLDLQRAGLLDTWQVPGGAAGLWEVVTW